MVDLDPGVVARIIVLVVLVILSGFFSSAETALTTVNKLRIRALTEEKSKRAIMVSKLIENPSKMLSAILIGNNIVNLSASSLATTLAIEYFQSIGAGVITGILTIVILIFGEITPKSLATANAEKLSLFYAPVILLLTYIMTPVSFLLNIFSRGLLFLFRIDPNKKAATVTESELLTMVEVSHEEGVIESEERTMIFYEAPHKLLTTLEDLREAFGPDRGISLCRELTKLHEEVVRTTLGEAVEKYAANPPKGEFVLIVAGAPAVQKETPSETDAAARVQQLMEEGLSRKDAVKQTAKELDLPKNVVYDIALDL